MRRDYLPTPVLYHHHSTMSYNLRLLILEARAPCLRSFPRSRFHAAVPRRNFHSNSRPTLPQSSAPANNDVLRFYSVTANSDDKSTTDTKKSFAFHVSASFSPKNKPFRPAVNIYNFDGDLEAQRKHQTEAGQDSWFVTKVAGDTAQGVALGVVRTLCMNTRRYRTQC